MIYSLNNIKLSIYYHANNFLNYICNCLKNIHFDKGKENFIMYGKV